MSLSVNPIDTWNEIFEEGIENVLKEEKEMYLIGDINRDLLNCQIKKSWSDYIEPFGLTQYLRLQELRLSQKHLLTIYIPTAQKMLLPLMYLKLG